MKSIIHTPTNRLENSLDFYKKLNFEVISPAEPVVVTDGNAIIEINPDRFARAGIKLFNDSWATEVPALKKLTAVTEIEHGFLLSDPSGVWIYLIEGTSPVSYEKQKNCFGITGNFQGLSLETTDIEKSVTFWDTLGFSEKTGSPESGMVSCTGDDGMIVSLMSPMNCPHLFFNPSMTYFNGANNLDLIKKIREANVDIAEEVTYFNSEGIVDNIIIRDPGGYGFFMFND